MQIEKRGVSLQICLALALATLAGPLSAAETAKAERAASNDRARSAAEEEFGPSNDITNRARPGYDAIGVPLGGWTLFPEFGVGAHYSDNVFAATDDEKDDVAALFLPSLRLYSKTESYKADLGASSEIARYDEYSGEDYEDTRLWANGQLGAGSVGWIDAEATQAWLHQLRTSTDDVLGSDLTKYQRSAMYLAYTHSPGSL